MHKGIHTIMIYMTDNDVGNTFRWQSEKKKDIFHCQVHSSISKFLVFSLSPTHTENCMCYKGWPGNVKNVFKIITPKESFSLHHNL